MKHFVMYSQVTKIDYSDLNISMPFEYVTVIGRVPGMLTINKLQISFVPNLSDLKEKLVE